MARLNNRNVYLALIAAGWTALDSRTDPRAYADASGQRFGTVEKDGVRLSLSINELLATHRGQVIVYSSCDTYEVILRAIIVDEALRRSGRAGRALGELVRLADNARVTVYLEPAPIADNSVPTPILTRLYEGFGFASTSESSRVMVRKPLSSVRKLGTAQACVLRMMNPEWISSRKKPDSMSLSILRSLEKRVLVYENFGRWILTPQGRVIKESLPD